MPPWCFAEQLAAHRHQPMLPWSLVEIPSIWLHVAAINPRIERPQLLDAPRVRDRDGAAAAAGYDHIVIDAPPVLGSADVNLMADAADAVVFAVRSRRPPRATCARRSTSSARRRSSGSVLVSD